MAYLSRHKSLRCFTTFAMGFWCIVAMAFPYVKYTSPSFSAFHPVSINESGFNSLDFSSPIITMDKFDWLNSALGICALAQLIVGLCTLLFSLIALYSLSPKSAKKLCNLLFSLCVVFLIVYAITGFAYSELYKNNKIEPPQKSLVKSLSYIPLLLSLVLVVLYAISSYMAPKPKTKVRYYIEEEDDEDDESEHIVIG